MIYVIGSGPAGVAAAWALVRQGIAVTMLDVGEQIEPARERLVDKLYAGEAGPTAWDADDLKTMKGELKASAAGIPLKRTYGSDFPHRDSGQTAGLTATNAADVLTSGARGGFSNVWGAQLMPYLNDDIADWCVTPEELAPHYRAVLDFVPLSARHDDLAEYLPLYRDDTVSLRPSQQGAALLAHMDSHCDDLRARGIIHGTARTAVQVSATADNPRGCVYCGLCMHGCPFRLIYNSAQTLATLRRDPHFRYVPQMIVTTLNENADGVEIVARPVGGDAEVRFQAERVYLGAGAVSTARILLRSLDAYDRVVTLHDSVQILMPMWLHSPASGVTTEPLHTLGQVNALIFDRRISPRPMHLQYYTFNDHFIATLRGMLRGLYPVVAPLLRRFVYGHLGVAFGYLHSDDSPTLAARLTRDPNGAEAYHVEGRPSLRTAPTANALVHKLWANRRRLGATPILPQVKVMPPGKSYHVGASFPMQATTPAAGEFACDRWGRPAGLRRVHVVDGSTLPSLASTTFTFTVMANAHRIASAHKEFGMAGFESALRAAPVRDTAPRRVGVTGARGYIGSRVAAHFCRAGWIVVEMTRGARSGSDTEIPFTLADPPGPDALRGLDAMIHCAWDLEARTRAEIKRVNVEGSVRLLRAAQAAGVEAIVFLSTVSAYGGTKQLYGQAKLEVEEAARAIGAYIVRPGLTYGPGAGGMVGKLAGALRLPVVPLIGTGNERQPLTHQDDLCRLLLTLCDEQPPVRGYPITAASQTVPTFREILSEIARAGGKKPHFFPIPYKMVYLLLQMMEKLGLKPNFRSDSVLGLVKPNPSLDFSATDAIGVPFREFRGEYLR